MRCLRLDGAAAAVNICVAGARVHGSNAARRLAGLLLTRSGKAGSRLGRMARALVLPCVCPLRSRASQPSSLPQWRPFCAQTPLGKGRGWARCAHRTSAAGVPRLLPRICDAPRHLEHVSVRSLGDLAVSGALLRSHAACTRPRPQRPARAFSFTRRTILGRSTPLQEMRLMVPGWWAGAQRTGIAAGARVCTCVYRVLYCGRRTMYTCVFSFKCGVLQCVPLNLDDINVFWNRLRCARGRADARTNEFTVSDDVTRMALWRSRIALETRYPRLRRSNKVVSARYMQYTAGTTRHGPFSSIRVRRASTQSRTSVPRSREHTAPPRSTPPLWRPRSTVGCSATIVPALGSTAVQQSACREPTERVSRAPGRLSVSAGIARMGRDTQNR